MENVYYEGQRIYFRPLELEDEPTLRRWVNHPQNWATLARWMPQNAVREREWLEKLYKDPSHIVFGVVVRDGDRLIGCCGLHNVDLVNRCAELGILIGELDFQGHGFGTEATALTVRWGFEVLDLHRVDLQVLACNTRGIKAYERCGFVLEGRERQRWHRGGQRVDNLRYAILRSEWQVARQARHLGSVSGERVGARQGGDGRTEPGRLLPIDAIPSRR